jgi:16S rRNA (guanine966-N2)-methyltransferase
MRTQTFMDIGNPFRPIGLRKIAADAPRFLYHAPVIRIISGEYRSRTLEAPEGTDLTRPMLARVKESLFGILRGWFDGTRVLDLFAGVGTMGRGAAEVVCVERDREVFRCLERNIARLGCGDRVKAIQGDALAAATLASAPRPVDVVFLDPPYELMEDPPRRRKVLEQAARCREVMAEKSFLVLRTPIDLPEDERTLAGLDGPEVHSYGNTMFVYLYMPSRPRPETPTP